MASLSTVKSRETIELKPSEIHGRGVFACKDISAGEVFEASETLRVPADQREFLDQTSVYDHYFEWQDDALIALSICNFLNHSGEPNADFEINEAGIIEFKAVRFISKGDEITISYGADLWFEST